MEYLKLNEEVLYTRQVITKVGPEDMELLKSMAAQNCRQRIRLCSHPDVNDSLHEMLIVHAKGNYVQPHLHRKKSESFHIIEGQLAVILFDETGGVKEIVRMGPVADGGVFYYRLSTELFHTVLPLSDFVIFHETTNGPFRREETVFASWAPAEDMATATDFVQELFSLAKNEMDYK